MGNLLDLYICRLPDAEGEREVFSPERRAALERIRNPERRRQSYWAWRLLEHALGQTPLRRPGEIVFHADNGRWSCAEAEFSISHTAEAAAIAISDRPVGVDAENVREFRRRLNGGELAASMLRRIAATDELREETPDALLRLWTGKESLFKSLHTDVLRPKELRVGAETRQFTALLPEEVFFSVSGERIADLRVICCAFDDGGWTDEELHPQML